MKNIKVKYVVALSFCLHAIGGILMYKLSRNSDFAVFVQVLASFSLIPIVLLAENYKKIVLYLLVAVSAVPIAVELLLLAVFVLGIFRGGWSNVTMASVKTLIYMPFLMSFLFIAIVLPYLIGALILRFVLERYRARTKGI